MSVCNFPLPKHHGEVTMGLTLPFGWATRTIFAGPYTHKPIGMFGIKLAPEVKGYAHVLVTIPDFGVPPDDTDIYYALRYALERLVNNQLVYVGCRGGKGRTGLFLALLARALGQEEPIAYVRRLYDQHAVETQEQEDYVANFDLEPLEREVARAKRAAVLFNVCEVLRLPYRFEIDLD